MNYLAIARVLRTKVLVALLTVASGVAVARLLGPEGRGEVGLIIMISSILALISGVGTGAASIYLYPKEKFSRYEFFWTMLGVRAFACLLISILGFLSYQYFLDFFGTLSTIDGFALGFLVSLFSIKACFLDLEKARKRFSTYNIALILDASFYLFLILILYFFDAFSVSRILVCAAGGCASLILFIALRDKEALRKPAFRFSLATEAISYGLKAFVGTVMQKLNLRLNWLIVAAYSGAAGLGLYTAAIALVELIIYFADAIGDVLFPAVASSATHEDAAVVTAKMCRVNLIVTSVACACLWTIAPFLIATLYGDDFSSSSSLVRILLPGIIALTISKVISKYFAGIGRPEINTATTGIALVVMILITPSLIQGYGTAGAAYASVIVYISRCVLDVCLFMGMSKIRFRDLVFPTSEDLSDVIRLIRGVI